MISSMPKIMTAARKNNNINIPQNGPDYLMTMNEVCEALGKSSRTITRYVRRQILRPHEVKSCQGTLEYRFSYQEVAALRNAQKKRHAYLFDESGRPNPLPARHQAKFASYGYSPVIAPTQPFLVPGVAFPVDQGRHFQPAPQNFYPPVFPQRPVIDLEKKFEDSKKNKCRQKTEDKSDVVCNQESQVRADEQMISLLKETTEMLRDQLKTKDDQIKNLDDKIGQLIERNRETNILLKGLQDKIMLLERPDPKQEIHKEPPVLEAKKEEAPAKEVESDDRQAVLAEKDILQEDQKTINYELPMPPSGQKKIKLSDDIKKKGLFGKIFG